MAFKEVDIKSLNFNPFTKIGSEWMLITAGDESGCNTMTASWGGLGVLWGKNVATCYIRPQRYTKKFVDANDTFTLSFYGPEYKQALSICGSKSGRDCDKVKEAGLTPYFTDGTAAFEEAGMVFVCRKLYEDEIRELYRKRERWKMVSGERLSHCLYCRDHKSSCKRIIEPA